MVHELVHVVQQIHNRHSPGWLIEGSADYIRWFQYEPESKRPRPDPRRAKLTDGYRTTAAFLNYLCGKYDKNIVTKLNAAMREGELHGPDLQRAHRQEPGRPLAGVRRHVEEAGHPPEYQVGQAFQPDVPASSGWKA